LKYNNGRKCLVKRNKIIYLKDPTGFNLTPSLI